MDEKLAKTLASPGFDTWRQTLWKEISAQAIKEGWVTASELTKDGTINHEASRWTSLWDTLVEIRYLFRPPVSRCVHARFRHAAKSERQVSLRYLSFHTSPLPTIEDKRLFEKRRAELLEWRKHGGVPPKICPPQLRMRPPKCH